jgi:sec-independent protein translocase protein TatA
MTWMGRYGKDLKERTGGIYVFGLGLTELVIILGIVLLVFGGRKLPELSRGLGISIRNFKKGLHEPDAIDITPKKEEGTSQGKVPPKPRA